MKLKELYITNNLSSLDSLAQRDKIIHGVQKWNRFSSFSNKMLAELMQCQDDQEKCYILCKRYIYLMDHLFKISNDPNYLKVMYSSDYRRVEQLVMDLKDSLQERYKKLLLENNILNPTDISSMPLSKELDTQSKQIRMFTDTFIGPLDVFSLLQKNQNFLLVDIRPHKDYQACRINCKQGTLINISEELIVPGLSANTMGLRLDQETQKAWEKRETFDIIVLLDRNTTRYNYMGSKLERLRSFIVEWDTGRQYKEEPVILNGGLKEFVECYPSSVENSHILLSNTNCDMDELLDLEGIVYPEAGSMAVMRLKIHSEPQAMPETNLANKDMKSNESNEDIEQVVPSSVPSVDSTPVPDTNQPERLDDASIIQKTIEDKEAMLRMARDAAKPKVNIEHPTGENSLLNNKNHQNVTPLSIPQVDRSDKPENLKKIGDGYTGLRNVKNICYMNCLLQCLKVIPAIKWSYVTTNLYKTFSTRTPSKMNDCFAEVLRELWGGTVSSRKVFYIADFKKRICEYAPMYDQGNHEDWFEFFIILFHAVNRDCEADLPREMMTESEKAWYVHFQGRSSFWVDTFYFQIKNTRTCCNCRKANVNFDIESILIQSMPNMACNLQDMIEDSLKEVNVTDFSCNNCKLRDTIILKKELTVEPEVLGIVLKRYMVNNSGTLVKNDAEIDFPLRNLRFGKSTYDLCSVVGHSGNLTHGHYYATVQLDKTKDSWFLFNDENIIPYTNKINLMPRVKVAAAGFFYVRNTV